jgi:hypothetical protein
MVFYFSTHMSCRILVITSYFLKNTVFRVLRQVIAVLTKWFNLATSFFYEHIMKSALSLTAETEEQWLSVAREVYERR